MTSAGPPKCKTCGKSEWQHLCSGSGVVIVRVRFDEDGNEVAPRAATRAKSVPRIAVATTAQPAPVEAGPEDQPVGIEAALPVGAAKRGRPKFIDDMKKYKAEKARERRAKQKGVSDAKGEGST